MDEKQKHIPVYPYSAQYAFEHGELDAYSASYKANLDCVDAIRLAVSRNCDNERQRFDTWSAMQQIVEKCGMERALYVLANTIREQSGDGRISQDNIAWAANYPVADDVDTFGRRRNYQYSVDAIHPGLTNLLTREMRKEAEREKKPSIRAQLMDAPARERDAAMRPADREAR